jgi:ABC-type glycerol-3-phosphate transport system permease component
VRAIKLPALRGSLVVTVIFSIIGTFQMFNEPQILPSMVANSGVTTFYTPNLYAYNLAFTGSQQGYAAALALVMAAITIAVAYAVQIRGCAMRRTTSRPGGAGKTSGRGGRLHAVGSPRKSTTLTVMTGLFTLYCLLPLVWLVINATKSQADFVSSFGLAPGREFALWDNIVRVFGYQDGIFSRWLLNTVVYVVVGATVSTFLAALGGYALAKLDFTGKRVFLLVVLGSISVPGPWRSRSSCCSRSSA